MKGSFPRYPNLRKGWVCSRGRGYNCQKPILTSSSVPTSLNLMQGVGESLSPGVAAQHQQRHEEVSAGVHRTEGGASTLSEEERDWVGRPTPNVCLVLQGLTAVALLPRASGKSRSITPSYDWSLKCPSQTVILHLWRDKARGPISERKMGTLQTYRRGRKLPS